jgi:hypothetical protein
MQDKFLNQTVSPQGYPTGGPHLVYENLGLYTGTLE